MTAAASSCRRLVIAIAAALLLLPCAAPAGAQPPAARLAQLQFDIIGARLEVDPPVLTVPKNIATQINTKLVLPPNVGPEAQVALATLASGATVEAQLHGPGISPPVVLSVQPGQPIALPAFALPGDYFLDRIRLVKDGADTLGATDKTVKPVSVIPITVIADILITTVTSRPLTLDEIRTKGVVIDERNFQALNFEVAFNIEGTPFKLNLPVAMPTRDFLEFERDRDRVLKDLSVVNAALSDAQVVSLPPQFDRPGLNFYIAALPFVPVEPDDRSNFAFGPPPIAALVVIQGNIGFLNQHFGVKVMVTNAAPDGTPLNVRDLTSTIELPKGLDRVAGTVGHPDECVKPTCDDPLRLARIQGVGQQPVVPVVGPGPDGTLGTADDRSFLVPQAMGNGEHVVEALVEGFHTVDITINAVLDGLPSGPVNLIGKAQGAVLVRDPTFSIALSQPRTVNSGELFDLFATVTNTSQTVANLLSVSLHKLSISGADLVSDPTRTFDTLAPGQSVVAKFRLRSQQTGQVTFSSFNADPGLTGSIQLRVGIGERGVPLSPNVIVLPRTADYLPDDLVTAAQRVLGQALNVAIAPAGALPPDVLYVKRQTVIDRGLALAEAGQRVKFGESIDRVLADLALDWFGSSRPSDGFDQLLRSTEAGSAFQAEMAKAFNAASNTAGVLDFQRAFAEATVARAGHLSAIAGLGSAGAPVLLRMFDDAGHVVGPGDEGPTQDLAAAGLYTLKDVADRSDFAVVSRLAATKYTIEATATGAGVFDLGVVVPTGAGQLRQLRFAGVPIGIGGIARVVVDLAAANSPSLGVDGDGNGTIDQTFQPAIHDITEGPPHVLTVRQLDSSFFDDPGNLRDPATYGLLVAVLLDKPVTEESVETASNYTIDANEVAGAQLQPSGRLVYLYLRKPIGTFVDRRMTLSNITDLAGRPLIETAPRTIETVLTDGGRLFGHVQTATGQPVPNAVMSLTIVLGQFGFLVATIHTDRDGAFDFDYVPRLGDIVLLAQHPVTLKFADSRARIRAIGERLLINPTFLGRGSARGRVLAADGVTPVPNAIVVLFPSTFDHVQNIAVNANAFGEYVIPEVPVGTYTVKARDGAGGFGQSAGLVASADSEGIADVVLTHRHQDSGRLIGRVFQSDGETPAARLTIYVGTLDRTDPGKPRISVVDQTTSDETGTFALDSLPAGGFDAVAVDAATGQLAVSRVNIAANTTSSTALIMEATGIVEGVVFNAKGQPVKGALVAGGISLGETDVNGFFHIEGVPAGKRTIESGDPVTRRRGSASVTVFSGQTTQASITLEARATIIGRVFDANGNAVPKATVRIPQGDGFTFVFANNDGVYRFPDLQLGDYLIEAPGPSQESLIEFMKQKGMDPASAFTSGDCPPDICVVSQPVLSDANAALAAYRAAIQTFIAQPHNAFDGPPPPPATGFGWNKVRLFQDSVTETADVKYLAQGTVSGITRAGNGQPTAALLRVSSVIPSKTGAPQVTELGRLSTDPVLGTFSFGGIARFDLATFQATGIRSGDFTLEAAAPFSPTVVQLRGQLNVNTPNQSGLVLQFPLNAETNGTITGRVFMPDGSPAPGGVKVRISFGDLAVTTDADGRFQNLFPIPDGPYTLTAEHPLGGLKGQAFARVQAGANVDVQITLLGLGNITITVKRPNGDIVSNAKVTIQRGTFPRDAATGTTTNGTIRFANLSEGPFSATVEELVTGLKGLASGTIVRDIENSQLVVITASGLVTGTFVAPDARTPIANAQITLTTRAGVRAFSQTDQAGRFVLTAIPVGAFTVEGHDPLTGRLGRATGELFVEGQTLDVTIIEVARGTVAGFVLQSDGITTVPGAPVSIRVASFGGVSLQATTKNDGSFRFEGIAVGTFTMEAQSPVSQSRGSTTGEVTFEGQTVDQNVLLSGVATIHVHVVDTDGQAADNASVEIRGGKPPTLRQGSIDINGDVTFELLPLGKYRVVARSLAESHNGGTADTELTAFGQIAEPTINLRGTGQVDVTVVASNSSTVVPSAKVTLTSQVQIFGDTFTVFTNASGVATVPGVPVGDFFVKGESGAVAGLSTGSVTASGQHVAITVQLGASGSITGRALLPPPVDTIPAAQTNVTLNFQSQSSLQSGVLQVTTGLDGRFSFSGIPLGQFKVSLFEPTSDGARTRTGTLTTDGEEIALGDLVLDNTAPHVDSITPADKATGVPVTSAIAITFSEPMDATSFITSVTAPKPNLFVLEATHRIAGTPSFSADRRTVTFTPVAPFKSSTLYTVVVTGVPDGARDESGRPLLDPFSSTFTARDVVPPAVTSVSPKAGERQILPEASIRVTFSEPIAPSMSLTLTEVGSGQPVPGQVALAVANTVAIFSPAAFLKPNATYTIHASGVMDLAGNPLTPGALLPSTFFTVDTIKPVIDALQANATRRTPGSTVRIQPTLVGSDVNRVEYRIGTGAAQFALASPFAIEIVLPSGVASVTTTAVAIDQVGNRSDEKSVSIDIETDHAPTVTMVNSSGVTTVAQGQSVTFLIAATDDAGLSQVIFTSVGDVKQSTLQNVPGTPTQFSTQRTVTVPMTAPSNGSFAVQAAVTDTGGNRTTSDSQLISIRDGRKPTVSIGSPADAARILPGQLDVTVTASDDVGLTRVALVCVPAIDGCVSREIGGAASTSQTFTLQIPDTRAGALTLRVDATDTSNNATTVIRNVHVIDVIAPEMTALGTVSGATEVPPGSVTVRARATDNLAVTSLMFRIEGLPIAGRAVAVTPPTASATVDFTFTVPADTPAGSTFTVVAKALDADGNTSTERSVALGVTAAPENQAPTANAGADQSVPLGATVHLNGTPSTDPNNDALAYSWTLASRPAGSTAALNNPAASQPTFVADRPGTYIVELVVSDGAAASAPDMAIITTLNSVPIAHAGPDQTVGVPQTVTLNGSESTDPDSEPLTFRWSFASRPAASNAVISDTTAVSPTFDVDVPGVYLVRLIVNDGKVDSPADTVRISTQSSRPVANAGPDQTVTVGSTVFLNGNASTDVDGDLIAFAWSFTSMPSGSAATLTGANTATPTFVVDRQGTYVVQLTVSDSVGTGAPDTVSITTINSRPVANAGPDQTVTPGSTVELDGSASTDVDENPLSFNWSFTSVPEGSTAVLSDPTAVKPTFVADKKGTYIVQLIVNDGTLNSAADTVSITTTNSTPVAQAGLDQTVAVGATVFVDATGSSDPDNDSLSYQWSITQRPLGSTAQLATTSAFATSFVADVGGTYIVQLIVNDGFVSSAPDTVTISTGNVAPVANAGPDQLVTLGQTVQLEGGGSTDANNDLVTYSWSLTSVPAGSAAALSNTTIVNPAFVADLFGTYVAQLIVRDATLASAPDTVSITVRPGTIALALVGTALVGVGSSERLAITISPAAPAGGALVTVTSDDTSVLRIGPPAFVLIPAGGTAGEATVNGISAGTATVRANAPGYTEGTLTIGGTPNVISVPPALTVAPGQSISLPISIAPSPAPSGGLAIAVASSDPSRVQVLTPTVTIPQGAVSANATIRGTGVGVATVTASRADYVSGRSQVTTTANLNIVQNTATFNAGFTSTITIQLESAGAQVAAPAPGIAVTLTAANPACVAATSPVTIATGLTSVTSTLSYGGSATLPCSTIVTARATDLTSDTMTVTVNQAAAITLSGFPATIGAGLQPTSAAYTATLGASQHGGVTLHIESSNAAVALVAPDTTTAGTASIDVPVANGTSSVSFVVQGVEGAPVPASATITASATGFTNASATANIVRPALEIINLIRPATTLSPDDPFQIRIGLPNSTQAFVSVSQEVRRGGTPLTATVTLTNPAVAQLVTTATTGQTVTVTIPVGQSTSASTVATGGVAFRATTPGQTTVAATIPGFLATADATPAVTITGPAISFSGFPATIGAGLQPTSAASTATLGASQHGGVTLHIESSNAAVALIAPNTTTAGTASIDVPVANGTTSVSFVVQGVEGAPVPTAATITASATGFTSASATANIVQPALEIINLIRPATTLSPDDPFQIRVGLANSTQGFLSVSQEVRRGGTPLTATLTLTNPSVAQLVTTATTGQTVTVTIPVGQSTSASTVATGGVAFRATSPGQTTVAATIAGFLATADATPAVTITGPAISFSGFPATIGAGLQPTSAAYTATLGASQHGGVTLHIESSNAAVALIAPNTTTAGTASIDVPVANGTTSVSFVVQGVEGAPVPTSATITASATGFTTAGAAANIVQPALEIINLNAPATTLSPDDPFQIRVGLANSTHAFLSVSQEVRRGGTPLTVTVTHTNPAIAQLITTAAATQTVAVTIAVGQSTSASTVAAGGVAFHPLSTGLTTVAASIPGFLATTDASRPITVNAPAISLSGFPATIGAGLQPTSAAYTAMLGASQHGGVTLHIESSNAGVALVAPNTTTAGTASIDVPVANGTTSVSFVVQGVESAPVPATVTITASAVGFVNGTAAATIVQPALEIINLVTSATTLSPDDPFQVRIGLANITQAFLSVSQDVRWGGTPLTVTVTHTNPAVAQLRATTLTARIVTITIAPGQSSSASTVAAGGVAFDPLAAGQTTVTASIPGFIVTTAGSVTVNISP